MKELLAARDKVVADIETMHKKAIVVADKVADYSRMAAEQKAIQDELMSDLYRLETIYNAIDDVFSAQEEFAAKTTNENLLND